jgi:hypothetical protein
MTLRALIMCACDLPPDLRLPANVEKQAGLPLMDEE